MIKNKNKLLLWLVLLFTGAVFYFFWFNIYKEQLIKVQEDLLNAIRAANKNYSPYQQNRLVNKTSAIELIDVEESKINNNHQTIFYENFDNDTAFKSDYELITPYFSEIKANTNGWFWLTKNPSAQHKSWFCKPYKSELSNFLLLDGALKPYHSFYKKKLKITKNKFYKLSLIIASVSQSKFNTKNCHNWQIAKPVIICNNDSFLVEAPIKKDGWKKCVIYLKSLSDTLNLSFFNLNTGAMYNDFAIDELKIEELNEQVNLTRTTEFYFSEVNYTSPFFNNSGNVYKEQLTDELSYNKLSIEFTVLVADNSNLYNLNGDSLTFLISKENYKTTQFSDKNQTLFATDLFELTPKFSTKILAHNLGSIAIKRCYKWLLILILFYATICFLVYNINKINKIQHQDLELRKQMNENITHELKTPITTIISALEAIKLTQSNANNQYIDIAIKQGFKLNNLVNKALEISLLDEDKLLINPAKINPAYFIYKIITQNFLTYSDCIHLIDKRHDKNTELIQDPFHFENVVSILIDNAIKYNVNNPKIIIEIENKLNALTIRVSDNGIGINQKEFKKIFERFYRVYTPKLNIKGHGLGLNYVKQILKKQNSSIIVQKSIINEGTTFLLTFYLNANS